MTNDINAINTDEESGEQHLRETARKEMSEIVDESLRVCRYLTRNLYPNFNLYPTFDDSPIRAFYRHRVGSTSPDYYVVEVELDHGTKERTRPLILSHVTDDWAGKSNPDVTISCGPYFVQLSDEQMRSVIERLGYSLVEPDEEDEDIS